MLSLERYAIIRAAIEAGGDRDRALADADVLPREWLLVERRWHRQLVAEAARGRTDLAARYLAAFNGAAVVDSPAPQASQAEPTPGRQTRVTAPSAQSAPSPLPAAGPARGVPSYMMAPAPVSPPPPVAPATAVPSTGEIDNRRLQRPPMPFSAVGAAPPTDGASKLPAPPAFVPSPARNVNPQTAYLDSSLLVGASTPFVVAPAAGGGSPPQSPSPAGASASQPKLPASSAGTGTALVDEAQVDLPAPTMPPELPTLSVDQYAWVTASLKRAKGAELDATLTRLRLTQASRVSLDAIWKAHMARYPAVKQAFILALGKHLSPP